MSDTYWAAAPVKDLAGHIEQKVTDYGSALDAMGRRALWMSAIRMWRGLGQDGTYRTSAFIRVGGESGEMLEMSGNEFRSLVRAKLNQATSQRLAYKAVATTGDVSASDQVQLAEQVWAHELERGMEERLNRCAVIDLLCGESVLYVGWNPRMGKVISSERHLSPEGEQKITEYQRRIALHDQEAEDGEEPPEAPELGPEDQWYTPIYEGQADIQPLLPIDVIRDIDAPDVHALPWVVLRLKLHKWELLASFPDKEVEIMGGCLDQEHYAIWNVDRRRKVALSDDYVHALLFMHAKTGAMPDGRQALIVGGEVIDAGPLPYDELPIVVMCEDQEFDEASGYADAWDLMATQAALDGIEGQLLSVSDHMPQLLTEEGQDIDAEDFEGSFAQITYKTDGMSPPPTWMDPPKIDAGRISLAERYESKMERNSGINSVVRGDPQSSLKSGAALALVASQSVQHASQFLKAYAKLCRDSASMLLRRYQQFQTQPKLIEITGEDQAASVQQFTADKIRAVHRIRVEATNPVMNTVAGRYEVAKDLVGLFPGSISVQQFFGLMDTGRLVEPLRAQVLGAAGLKEENSALLKGQPVQINDLDAHLTHIREHFALVNTPAARGNEQLAELVTDHCLEHIQHLRSMIEGGDVVGLRLTCGDEAGMLLELLGGMPQPGPPPGAPGEPPGDGPPEAMQPPQPGGPTDPMTGQAMPGMPNMPTNPATGQRAQAPGGVQ